MHRSDRKSPDKSENVGDGLEFSSALHVDQGGDLSLNYAGELQSIDHPLGCLKRQGGLPHADADAYVLDRQLVCYMRLDGGRVVTWRLFTSEYAHRVFKFERFYVLGIPQHFSNDDVNDLLVNTVGDMFSLQVHMRYDGIDKRDSNVEEDRIVRVGFELILPPPGRILQNDMRPVVRTGLRAKRLLANGLLSFSAYIFLDTEREAESAGERLILSVEVSLLITLRPYYSLCRIKTAYFSLGVN